MISLEGFSIPGVTTAVADEPVKDHEKAPTGGTETPVADVAAETKEGEEEKDWITEITDNLGFTSSSATATGATTAAEEGESWVPSLSFQLPDPFAPSDGGTTSPDAAAAAWPAFPNFWEQQPTEEKAASNDESAAPSAATTETSSAPWDMGGLWGSGESQSPPQPIEEAPLPKDQGEVISSSTIQENAPRDAVDVESASPLPKDGGIAVSLEREDQSPLCRPQQDSTLASSTSPTEVKHAIPNETLVSTEEQLKRDPVESATAPPVIIDQSTTRREDSATPIVKDSHLAVEEPNQGSPSEAHPDLSSTVPENNDGRPTLESNGPSFRTSVRGFMGLEKDEEKTPEEDSPAGSFFESIFGSVFDRPMTESAQGDEWDQSYGNEDACQDTFVEGDMNKDSSSEPLLETSKIGQAASASPASEDAASAVTDWLSTFQSFVSTQVTGVVDMVVTKPRHPKFHKNRAMKKTWTFPGF